MKHKVISFIILLVVIFSVYQIVKSRGSVAQASYTVGTVSRGTIVTSVSGTGQVSASDQFDLKTKAAGDITYLKAVVGQEVVAGTLIAQVDDADAAYQLENAKLSYDKLVTVDPDTLRKDQDAVTQAKTDLANSYVDARTSLAGSLTDLSDVSTGLTALFDFNTGYLTSGKYTLSDTAKVYQNKAESSWGAFDTLLDGITNKYGTTNSNTSNADIESIVADFYRVAVAGAQASKDAQDAVIYLRNNETGKNLAKADAAYSSVTSLVSKANGAVSNITSLKNSIANNKINLDNASSTLKTLIDGPDTLALRSSELSVKQAQETLDNYSVVAPFDGVIASVAINNGDTVSNGATVATLITKQKIAKISLNEIDAASVKVGQKATATFDAIPDLTLTGKVTSIDLIGTVSQGVVSYNVQVDFDVNDDRVKSGMTVSTSIITQAKTDVLMVPSSAVKTQGNSSYVEVFDTPPAGSANGRAVTSAVLPRQQDVTVGISSDTSTEILNGLKEGDSIVTKTTITGGTATTVGTASISSLLGGNRGGATTRATTGGFTRPAGN